MFGEISGGSIRNESIIQNKSCLCRFAWPGAPCFLYDKKMISFLPPIGIGAQTYTHSVHETSLPDAMVKTSFF